MTTFDQWLTRGASPKTSLRKWFMSLLSEGELAQVEVDGEPSFVRVQDSEEIAGTEPSRAVRLLPAFDQYVLDPGTMNAQIVSTVRRHEISRAAGWITPVVLVGGRVSGTWDVSDHMLDVRLFAEVGKVPATAIEEEAERLAAFLGFRLTVSTRIT